MSKKDTGFRCRTSIQDLFLAQSGTAFQSHKPLPIDDLPFWEYRETCSKNSLIDNATGNSIEAMIKRADIKGAKSNVAMNAWLPPASQKW
jgi:hypothetical protein